MSQNERDDVPEDEAPSFISHLIELRNRLLRVVVFVLVLFLCAAPFANEIYVVLAEPLLRHIPENSTMIATDVASPFFTPFKLTLIASIFVSIPVILFHFWAFLAPGLYSHEKTMVFPLLIASTGLFYLGVAFAYFVVFPLIFGFLTAAAPEGVAVMTDITKYLDFILTLFFAFGLSFEVPIFTVVLVWSGLVSRHSLAEKRPYVIVAAFILGMFLTPPDAISQTLLAVPIWMLFEIGLLFSRFFERKEV
ncbi:MAG: twin-arginine translocase subunit TatC [Methylococcales symbiont of Iophon sp. n. MRB-2018]|nr:MAG: twin-arginine translocase subunit TatC [Methylococcales symbiont of Iophon sp. n. MRB-2018]KAF3980153.1 MAG: twin-arginine translocase subunit TatC [Methylococcales symbiont of Iophon sp. n. MRB-2018]